MTAIHQSRTTELNAEDQLGRTAGRLPPSIGRDENHAPTLSVVMPIYNHSKHLAESIGSILAQSYRPHEIILLDDASTDDSLTVMERFARDEPLIRIVRNPENLGVNASCNRLLALASGEYIVLPASDDKVLPGFYEKSMALLRQHRQAGLCCCMSGVMDENGHDKGIIPLPLISLTPAFFSPSQARGLLLAHGNWISGNTVIWRRQALVEAGGYLPELLSLADGFANLVVALRYGFCYVPEPLAVFRRSGGSYSSECSSSYELLRAWTDAATTLMQTRFHEIFPRRYIKRFRRQMLFTFGLARYRAYREQQQAFLTQLQVLPRPNTLMTTASRTILKGLIALEHLSVMVYLITVLGYVPMQAIKKRIDRLLSRFVSVQRPG